ncbi:MAG TPA: GNAT family N-acetyltransferase [Candidatus Binatia bacterium]|nr:GNAT family N-acetyltransferase [Candidatus Binatia bacterium]
MPETTAAAATEQLPDFVDVDFARRLELAETILPDCVEGLRRFSPADPIAAEDVAGGVAFFGGLSYPANQAVGMGLYGEVTAGDLDRVEHFFRSRGVASTIVLSPLAHESLRNLLGGRGYAIAEFNSVLIRRISPHEPFTPPAGVSIERVTPETLRPWMHAIARGFSEELGVAEEVFGGFATLPGALAFLARIGDTVVGGCGGRIIAEACLAALYGTATLPEFRRRGVQSALIARRLHEAAPAGCEYAVVCTHPGSGSQRNMERRGFRLAYTKVVMVRQWPETATAQTGVDHGH